MAGVMAGVMTMAAHDSLPPRGPTPGAAGRAVLLAVLAHALLIVALTLNLDWQWRSPEVAASAELWAAVPQVAAPPLEQAPPPPPPPEPAVAPVRRVEPLPERQRADAQIAIEKARKAKRAQEAQEQAQAQAEAQRLIKAQDAQKAKEAQKAKDAKQAEQQRQALAEIGRAHV